MAPQKVVLGPELPTAACAGRAPMFDAEIHGETRYKRRKRMAAVRLICAACPVRAACSWKRLPTR